MLTWVIFAAWLGGMIDGEMRAILGAVVFAAWALWREQDC